jgi:hypothetical protein
VETSYTHENKASRTSRKKQKKKRTSRNIEIKIIRIKEKIKIIKKDIV